MPDVAMVLAAFAALALLAATAYLAFRAGRFWGATRSKADPLSKVMSAGHARDEAPNWERYLREKTTSVITGIVVEDDVPVDDVADVLRAMADELDPQDDADRPDFDGQPVGMGVDQDGDGDD